ALPAAAVLGATRVHLCLDILPLRPHSLAVGQSEGRTWNADDPERGRFMRNGAARTRPMASLTRGRSTVAEVEKSNRAVLVGVAVGTSVPVLATSTPGYNTVNVGAYGGEPSIVSDSLGQLYDSTPSGGTLTYTSTNHGRSWAPVTTAALKSGDDCLATDQSNS